MKAYKIFNPDFSCRNYQYEIGGEYKHEGEIVLCSSGFHFCKELKNVFNYYRFDYKNPICEIEVIGDIIDENNGDKSVTDHFKIIRQLSLEEILVELNLYCSYNIGSSNSGSDNSGSYNSGSSNRGSYNIGSSNSGSSNIGSSNSGSDNRGIFNFSSNNVGAFNYTSFLGTKEKCYCFNEPTNMSMLQFAKTYLNILRDIKKYNFTNVNQLPNYTQEKWDLIKTYI